MTHARLFFALWPDADTRAALARVQRSVHPLCGGRVMHPNDVHLTLAFLGDTPLEQFDAVKRIAGGVAGAPFRLRVDELRYWSHNRIVWAGPSAMPAALVALAESLRDRLTASRIRFDAKAFVPHITLLRNARPASPLPALPPIEWPVEDFALIRSTGGKGPRYRVEARWPLNGTAQ